MAKRSKKKKTRHQVLLAQRARREERCAKNWTKILNLWIGEMQNGNKN